MKLTQEQKRNFFKSMKSQQMTCGITRTSIPVTLEHSDNTYITYPVTGVLTILEQTVSLNINVAIFNILNEDGSLGAPVRCLNPQFKYGFE